MQQGGDIQLYINVNGIKLYYEKSGQGNPIILLHGNCVNHNIFNVLIKQLSPDYTVYAIDSRDHGKSSRVKSLDYQTMTEDVALFIQELDIEKPMLYGFSDGGIVGILLAIKYPDMLSKLIVSGANLHPDGNRYIFIFLMKVIHFVTRSRKFKLMLTQPNITQSELSRIIVPTLVLAGSRDFIKDEHTKAIAEGIPISVLKILDGEGHMSYVLNNKKLYEIIKPFLAGVAFSLTSR